jgi:cytochrome c oxidase cbb3-type subunit 3
MEVAAAEIAIAEYKKNAKDLVDASTVELLTEASDLAAGKQIYDTNCVACHMADGGGGIGPNLADQHWILGGGIKNVFSTISEGGRDGKGMVAWKQILKPVEMAQVASYVLTLQGTTPANPKEAEGELWEE